MRDTAWLVAAVALALAVQSAGVRREFLADDYMHLYQLATLEPWPFLLQTYAGHVLVTFHAALMVLHGLFGLNATAYYLVVLATHGLNVALLWLILRRHTAPALAALFAGMWGIAPVNQGALGWISVYGYVLCTTFVLSAWALLEHYFALARPVPGWVLALCAGLLAAGAASFGVGIAVAFVFPAVAWLLAPSQRGRRRVVLGLAPLLLLPALYLVLRPFVDPSPGASAPLASIQLFVRLLAYGSGALLLGPIFTVSGVQTAGWPFAGIPGAQIVSYGYPLVVALGVVLAGTMWVADGRARRTIVAALLLAAAAYAIVAAGRVHAHHLLDWAASRPRYHYLPLALAALALGAASSVWGEVARHARWQRPIAIAVGMWALALVIGSWVTARNTLNPVFARTQISAARVRAQLAARIHRSAPGAPVFIDNTPFPPVVMVMRVAGKSPRFPGIAGYFAMIYGGNTVAGRRVRFVERDEALVRQVRQGSSRRMAELLITESEAAAARGGPHAR
jgi:hypothetical protein